MNRVDRETVRRMQREGAPVIEVLPVEEYDDEHLSGATSIPLTRLDASAVAHLDRDRPVVVYCWDYQ